jgi:dTDP-4-amino-4,6-dideoxygalactose transaminase
MIFLSWMPANLQLLQHKINPYLAYLFNTSYMIPFSPPRIDQKTIDAVTETLKSGWITTGPKTKLFEKKLTEYNANKRTLCLNSATAGLEIMLRWFGVGEGDEVIVPAYTYSATANVIIHCGARPVFVDVNNDFLIDVIKVKEAITGKTKVIMPVDFAGFPCDYAGLNSLVNAPEVKKKFSPAHPSQEMLGRIMILSDAAHSIGALYNSKRTGSLTDASVFSFHAVKNLTTAEGGAVALNLPDPFSNDAIYDQLCILTLHGQNKDALAKAQKGNWRYDIVEAGYKYNMTDIMAAIGLIELERYESEMLPKRKHIFEVYSESFQRCSWAEIPPYQTTGKKSSYHLYALRIKGIDENQRDEIMRRIFNRDVSVNVHFIPVPMFTYYKNAGYKIADFPVSYDLYSREISLPVYYDLTDEQLQQVITTVIACAEEVINQKPVIV